METNVPSEVLTNCPNCESSFQPNEQFCTNCGYPLHGTEEQKQIFVNKKYIDQVKYEELNKKVRRGTTTLFVLAGIFFVFGLIYYGMNEGAELAGALLWTNIILGIVFIALGFWSKSNALAAQISGLVLFILVQLLAIFEDPSNIVKGIIMKIFVIVFLIRGISSAMESAKFRKAHNIT